MNDEQQFNEIEKTMFDLSGACRRARKTIGMLEKGNAPEHLIEAMRASLTEMEATHKRLMQGTYWAVPEMRAPATASRRREKSGTRTVCGRSASPVDQARNVEKKTSPPAKARRKSLTSSEAGIRRSMSRG